MVVGATSGIGRAVAEALADRGDEVGVTGRRTALLEALVQSLPSPSHGRAFDVCQADARAQLQALFDEMGGVDLVVVCAGTGFTNPTVDWSLDRDTLETNVVGFAAMCNVAWHHFVQRGGGHLVGISSVLAVRGMRSASYAASKAFVSHFLAGLRCRAVTDRHAITVTDIKPGFVRTAMAKADDAFWMASPEVAARQIVEAIEARRSHAYVTRRWRVIAWLLKAAPEWLIARL